MKEIIVVICSVFFCCIPPAFAQMYKWTDESGKTHYTQTPPPASAADHTDSLKIKVHRGTPTAVTLHKGRPKCGSLSLPRKTSDKFRYYNNLRTSIEIWNENKKHVTSPHYRSIASSQKQKQETENRIGEYECAIAWASKKLESNSQDEKEFRSQLDKYELELSKLQSEQQACKNNTSTGFLTGNEAKKALSCFNDYDPQIIKLKKLIKKYKK